VAPTPRTAPDTARGVAPARAAAIAVFGILVLYLVIIAGQGWSNAGRVAIVSVFLGGCGTMAWLGTVGSIAPPRRTLSLIAASAGLWSAAVISLFSIGIVILVAAILATVATVRATGDPGARPSVPATFAALTLPPLTLIGGIALS
jgi:hypothetical protein